MNKKYYRHRFRSKHIPNDKKLIKKLNKFFNWEIPEDTKMYKQGNSIGIKTGWYFNWYFVYEHRIYGAMISVTDMLRYKTYSLYDNGSDIEIQPN